MQKLFVMNHELYSKGECSYTMDFIHRHISTYVGYRYFSINIATSLVKTYELGQF